MKRHFFDPLVIISPAGIESHLKDAPLDLEKKRGIELLAGCVLARAFEVLDGHLPEILIPMRSGLGMPPTLEEIIANPELHVDDDVDLYLKNIDNTAHPVQVTELEEHFSGADCSEGLLNLIKRKSKRSQDEDMILAVLANLNGVSEIEKVKNGLEDKTYPFGHIFLLGQFGDNITLGRFTCQMLYPRFLHPVEVQLNW
jgi:hypothetical protein